MTPRRRVLPLFIPHLGCPHDCVFCNQRRVTGALAPVTPEQVTAALEALDAPVDELAFYGGSFTALPAAEQAALLDAAAPFLRCGKIGSIRVSTRPDAVDPPVPALLRRRGVETVELGAQSMDDAVLRRCGRGHTAGDTVRAVKALREAGFRVVLQMMTGLPGSTPESDLDTGRRLAALAPDGVRIYPTVVLRDTPLWDLWRRGAYREHTVDDAVEVCARLLPVFAAAGVPVIRLGLNPTEALSRGGAAAGAYHPALGELVQSQLFLDRARAVLPGAGPEAVLGVSKSDVSKMTGQKRRNLELLRREFHLASLRVVPADVPPGEVRLLPP